MNIAFNMGAKSTCHTDYLQIIEPFNMDMDRNVEFSPNIEESNRRRIVRQFCGGVRLSFFPPFSCSFYINKMIGYIN